MPGGDVQDPAVRDAAVRDADSLDAETVASIAAGERDGLAAAYDRYAPGLYAVARNECRYRLHSRAVPSAPGETSAVGEEDEDTADDPPADAEAADLRAAVGAALAGLSPAS